MSNDKLNATFHPGTGPEPSRSALLVLIRAGRIAGGLVLAVVNQIERHRIPCAKRYNAAHPPPPGQRSENGAAWVAKRSQDIDE